METSSNTYLLYHIVFSTKKRQKLIKKDYQQRLWTYMAGIIKNSGGLPVLINGVEDHVHILAFLPKQISISESLQALKGGSSFWYNKQFANNTYRLHWQEGYNIFSVSGSHLEAIKNYIFRQEEHHRNCDYNQEIANYEAKLREHYDPAKWNPVGEPETGG